MRKRHRCCKDAASLGDNWRNRRYHNDSSLDYKFIQRDPLLRKEIAEFSSRAVIAQRHIVAKGWGNRQVCSRYPTNSTNPVNPLVANRYANKVAGDSPEMAVSTDNQGNRYELVLITCFNY